MQFMPLGRAIARAYLALYDRAMRLGPMPGALVIGYGPIALAILAFLVKTPVFDPWLGASGATLAIFLVFATFGPLMNTGSKIVTEILHHRRKGAWPDGTAGETSPTMARIETLRAWAKERD